MKSHEYVEFPDIGVTVKMIYDANRKLYELVCGSTFVGTATTLDEGKTVARRWLNQLMDA